MFELHLIYMYPHHTFLIVTFHNDAEVGFVIEIRGAEDIVHLHAGRDTRHRIAIHLAWMGNEDDQTMVVGGKATQTIE